MRLRQLSLALHPAQWIILTALGVMISFFFCIAEGVAQRTHTVYYEGTEHELHVYRIHGKASGKTMMLIGGIQGDEPGGFLSADLYADFALTKGNLIVVPRANFLSILQNRRQINEDMNRKFADEGSLNYEAKVVAVLKKLIAESDCLLNLHDGSGFFSETYVSPERNPNRYGQSIIADSEAYRNPQTGEVIKLGEIARYVSTEMNKHINKKDYHFHFNNHRTNEKTTPHKEQRKSATYYALTACGIPAFGVESSKELPLDLKILHHNLAINAFMKYFGVAPETPSIKLDSPSLQYIVVAVSNTLPVVVENQKTLSVNHGDEILITHIQANYERGLSADLIDYGGANDFNKKIRITKPTRIEVRKDAYTCGSVYISLSGKNSRSSSGEVTTRAAPPSMSSISSSSGQQAYLLYKIKINKEERIYDNYSHIRALQGDVFEISDVICGFADPSKLQVNLKGFVADQASNSGEDRGCVIHTGKDLWARYSLDGKGKSYPAFVTLKEQVVGKFFLDLEKPRVTSILIKNGENRSFILPGETIAVDGKKPFKLIDIATDICSGPSAEAFITGPSVERRIKKGESLLLKEIVSGKGKASSGFQIEIRREGVQLGKMGLKWISSGERS